MEKKTIQQLWWISKERSAEKSLYLGETELIDVTLEEDFKPKGMDMCNDAFLNILSDVEDNGVSDVEDNGVEVDKTMTIAIWV